METVKHEDVEVEVVVHFLMNFKISSGSLRLKALIHV